TYQQARQISPAVLISFGIGSLYIQVLLIIPLMDHQPPLPLAVGLIVRLQSIAHVSQENKHYRSLSMTEYSFLHHLKKLTINTKDYLIEAFVNSVLLFLHQ